MNSTSKHVVSRQIHRSGNILLNAMSLVDDDEFFAENSNGLSAAWVVGHLACVSDLFTKWFRGELMFSSEFHSVFNDTDMAGPAPISKAASVDREMYSKADLLLWFRQAVVKALLALDAFDITMWDAPGPNGTPLSLSTGGEVWEVLAVHTYWHLGELSGSMPRFFDMYSLHALPNYFYMADVS